MIAGFCRVSDIATLPDQLHLSLEQGMIFNPFAVYNFRAKSEKEDHITLTSKKLIADGTELLVAKERLEHSPQSVVIYYSMYSGERQ